MAKYTHNLAQLFTQVVNSNPDAIALRIPNEADVSYQQLQQQSNQIARWLQAKGTEKGDVVAIFHDKSAAAFVAMLACLKLGAVYVNLDPNSPWERLRRMLKKCQPERVLSFTEGRHHQLAIANEHFLTSDMMADSTGNEIESFGTDDLLSVSNVCSTHPAYIMFTSGSTGSPKGAVISHGNLMNFVAWAQAEYSIDSRDVVTNVNPMFFDNSVFDVFVSLFSGATLLPVTGEQVSDSRELIRLVNTCRATIWFSVPSLLVYLLTTKALTQEDFPTMRKIVFGGEGFPKAKLKQLFELFKHRVDLHNVYGPTECTCICSSHQVNADDFSDMRSLATLGTLAANFGYQIAPTGADPDTGELLLLGPQVSAGYYNDADLTAQSFVQNPEHNDFREVCYRTGDLVARDGAGNLHFKGRADFQIKHLGYRIELEEIEAAIATLEGVDECVAVYTTMANGFGTIEAFIASQAPQGTEVATELNRLLPDYMVPKRIHWMSVLPKNANGKIDRTRLSRLPAERAAG